jgi:hypothetical protein
MLITMGDLMQAYDRQKEMSDSPETFVFNPRTIGMSEADLQASQDRVSNTPLQQITDQAERYQQIVLDKIEEIKQEIFQEGREMDSKDLLRQFIRESIYHDIDPLHAPQPSGYAYRNPKSTEDGVPESDGEYSSQIVQYKADMGDVEYQQRPDDLREEALRRIIRRKLKESKKKRS